MGGFELGLGVRGQRSEVRVRVIGYRLRLGLEVRGQRLGLGLGSEVRVIGYRSEVRG